MKKHLQQLGKDSIIYGFGGIVSKAVGFFLLPVYTRLFTPSEYGILEMLIVLTNLIGVLLTLGLDSAQSFYFFEQAKEGREKQSQVISSILQLRIISGIFIVIFASLFSPILNNIFLMEI
ncbi:MAG: lipopolysaccharide biosynthesis protein [Candidatus Hodarchaeota archaeon]